MAGLKVTANVAGRRKRGEEISKAAQAKIRSASNYERLSERLVTK
jgi:hypothetical protein